VFTLGEEVEDECEVGLYERLKSAAIMAVGVFLIVFENVVVLLKSEASWHHSDLRCPVWMPRTNQSKNAGK